MLHTDSEWVGFVSQVLKETGLDLGSYKEEHIRRRADSMMVESRSENLASFGSWILNSSNNTEWFLDRLAINTTELFRDPETWAELEVSILAELRNVSENLRIWSAGCSYGAEAFTIASILENEFPGNHTILGTDIDGEALELARAGRFSRADMRSVPARFMDFFTEVNGEFLATDCLRKSISFKRGNLLVDRFETGYDLIIFRNVAIYLTDTAKEQLFVKFYDALRPGGILLLGSSERVLNSREIGFSMTAPSIYQKVEPRALDWLRAS